MLSGAGGGCGVPLPGVVAALGLWARCEPLRSPVAELISPAGRWHDTRGIQLRWRETQLALVHRSRLHVGPCP